MCYFTLTSWFFSCVRPLFPPGPPSAPENPISTVNETCVTLEWSPPRDTGGRGDITYSIHCRKCSGEGRKCAPCGSSVHYIPRQYGLSATTVQVTDLQPDSNYSFTVESQNGVSDLSPTPRGTVAVNVTTSQTGEGGFQRNKFEPIPTPEASNNGSRQASRVRV